jgi:hypothetical protein
VPLTGDYTVPSYGPWIDDAPNTDIELVLNEISEALEGYEHAEEYDSINIWERFTLSREGRTLRQADIEFDPNLCSPVIDAVNDRLLITSVTASAGPAEDSEASDTATNLLGRVIKENELDVRYRTWDRKALRDGDAYIIVWPDQSVAPGAEPELSGDIDVQDVATPLGVNITYGDPRFCRMFYDPENPRRKLFFAQMWMQSDTDRKERIRMNLFYPDRIEKWISSEGTKQKKAADFRRYIDPDQDGDNDYPGSGDDPDDDTAPASSWPMPNPYGQVPVFHLRTDVDFGKPEHRNAWAEQAGLSQSVEILMTTMSFSAYPQRYALQEADSLGNQSVREDPFAEHSPADWDHDYAEEALSTTTVNAGAISNETGSEWEANPGTVQLFKNFKSVGQFATADVTTLIEPINKFANLISTATNTPLWKFAGLGTTMPSGEALKIAEEPLVRKVLDRMALFAGAWQAAYEFALSILNVTARVTVSWANPVTNDLMEVWNLVEKKISLGVPRAVAFMEAGVPEAQAQEWATTYSSLFAEAEYQQGRARMYLAQADVLAQEAVAAKIANGVPQLVALVEAGYAEADVQQWLADDKQAYDLSRKAQILAQITASIQQMAMGVSVEMLSKEGANAILVNLFGDLLPEVPSRLLEVEDEEEEEPPGAGGMPLQLPPVGTEPPEPTDTEPKLPPAFLGALPTGSFKPRSVRGGVGG